ncbi:MAG: adenosylcobinamide-GDP ribazoletransferase [Clostridia bacterium]|nr:adenosylcobinamide-GDP ribazoletransferase [Clostridia bacterium]
MKSVFESFFIAISMYSAIPVPIVDWNEKNMKNALCFFPLVGLICAIALWAVYAFCQYFGVNHILFAALAVFVNVLVTGGLHIDGFCDTSDAIFSRRSREEMLKILKDPNCGPFAVLSVIVVFLLNFSAYTQIYAHADVLSQAMLNFVLSRALSGISVICFPRAKTSTLAKTFGENASTNSSYILMAAALATVSLMIWNKAAIGIALTISSGIIFLYYYKMAISRFGGITGDLAGYFLVVCETVSLVLIALLGGVKL